MTKDLNTERSCVGDKHTKFTYFGPRLLPFLKTACIYFILGTDGSPPSLGSAIFKCLPMLSLCIFVSWFNGVSFASEHQYPRRILAGLVMSMLGDFYLVWADEGYFFHGVAFFAIAHVMYILAFGFNPTRPAVYLLPLLPGLLIYWYIYPGLTDVLLKLIVLGYLQVIMVMNWRAFARLRNLDDIKAGVTSSSHKQWTHLVASIGAALFFVSDSFLAIDRFLFPITYRWIVMTSYYLAQLGISLSVISTCYEEEDYTEKKGAVAEERSTTEVHSKAD